MAGDTPAPDKTPAPAAAPTDTAQNGGRHGHGFWALALGSVGVVFGDIGTSPLYAMREALHHSRSESSELAVIGVVSLVLWALTLVVTIKYVVFLMRADNKGEGGTLALMALATRALGRRSRLIFFLGIIGAALFYGDGIITPAISVLSSVELVKDAPGVGEGFDKWVIPIAAAILIGLFAVQAKGTHRVAAFFGPITALWFLTLAGLGILHISDDWSILRAFSPYYGAVFLFDNGLVGFIILGSVFLAVTGAEALYADMGHFGKKPIRAAWVGVFICLALNYLGQGALVLKHPEAIENPFAHMAPEALYWPVLILAMAATIIASQAVITGAFSLTQQAVQLGLLPRMDIKRTSETQAGQIYVPSINTFLAIGVMILLAGAGLMANPELLGASGAVVQAERLPSSVLASAYGIAVTGAMFVDTLLAYFVLRGIFKWSLPATLTLLIPLGMIDVVFMSSNLLKIPDGAWLPLVLGAALVVLMWTWNRGSEILSEKTRRDSVPLCDLIDIMRARAPHRVPGTAIFLTSDPEVTPVALMHNLKHNKVLHEKNVVLTVRTAETPRVALENRVQTEILTDDFKKVIITYGFMEQPNVPKALTLLRKQQGLKFDIMATSFFLGRRSVVPSAHSGMPLWQDKVFIFLMRNAANPTDFFKIPYGRVVELGAQVTV